MSLQTADANRHKQRSRLVLAVLLLLLLVVLIKGVLVGRRAYALWRHGRRLMALAGNPASLLQAQGPEQVKVGLQGVEQALQGLRAELRLVLRPMWLPWLAARENLTAVDELLRVGAEMAHAGQVASEGLDHIVSAMEARRTATNDEEKQSMSEALFAGAVEARPHFAEAAQQLSGLCQNMVSLGDHGLWPRVDSIVSMSGQYVCLGQAALQAAGAVPTMLGETKPITYMILLQNSDELRPTGGFITGIGLLTLEQGMMPKLLIMDSYDVDNFTVDHPWAPEPMQRYMEIYLWVTRDGNWSPDFPTAAQAVEDLYHLENSTPIAGMFAVDMFALQSLIETVGPLHMWRYEEQINGDNALEKFREFWLPELPERLSDATEWRQRKWQQTRRKVFMRALGRALMRKVQAQSRPAQLSSLLQVVLQAIEEKHILMYFDEPAAQHLLATAGLDATVERDHEGDYLLVLDTNMGYNKVNLNVEQSVVYEVDLGAATPTAVLTIHYHNGSPTQPTCERSTSSARTYQERTEGCYWSYVRVYAPLGAKLLAAEGLTETMTVSDEHERTVFGGFLVVPGGETRSLRLQYSLPQQPAGEYRLLVQKQAGTVAVPLRVAVSLPPGVRVSSADPEPGALREGTVVYELDLRHDRIVNLRFQ